MTTEAVAPGAVWSAALHAEVQQFYAHQMQRLDLGEARAWSLTFTEDAVFDVPTLPEPVRGRAGLVASARRARAQLEAAGERHRHVLGMLDVRPLPDGTVAVRAYAVVYATPVGGASRVHRMCVCEDVLVRGTHGGLLVAHRVVTRDDLP
ncbi:nuclear transport factor 2 family protein [Streptomyces antimicrobicus]|uniref:Nuclear transport factor 2 family protein n=1 Tax=Streptomyces antimicrobicus TaxID=2883108 RepID=A0ABS8B8T5_9ACTN|nr:nuclear transport factor 2 family protein [Streptomyces antimicrobicus]MCB5181023.1 nuclear transport factor 2 family protein [Streptomyces antimicrobicus]